MSKFQLGGISITAPDTYVDRSVYVVAATNSEGPFQRNLTLSFEPRHGRDVQQVAHTVEQQLLQMRLPGLRIGAKTKLRVSGHDAMSIDYASEEKLPIGQVRLVRRVVLVPVDERVLAATFTALEPDFAAHVAELDAIIASLQM